MCPLEITRSLDRRSWSHVATMQPGERSGVFPDFNKPNGTRDLIGYHCDLTDTHSVIARSVGEIDGEKEQSSDPYSRQWTVIRKIGKNEHFDVEITPEAGGRTWIYRFAQK